MEEIDTELFIDAIKSKPEIWDCSNEDYKNRLKKRDAWNFVCTLVVPQFEDKSDIEKNKIGKELQTRWKSIRDRHTRYLRETKTTKSGSAAKPKKNYIYAKHLDFLQPTVAHNVTHDSQIGEEDDSNHNPDHNEETPEAHGERETPSTSTVYRRKKRQLEDKFEKYLEVVTQRESENRHDKDDDDKAFFLSLIPNVKRLNEGDKLLFKAEVMQLLISYTNKPQLQHHQYSGPPYLGPQLSNVQTFPQQYSASNSSYKSQAPPQNFHDVFQSTSQHNAQGTSTQDERHFNNSSLSPATSESLLSL